MRTWADDNRLCALIVAMAMAMVMMGCTAPQELQTGQAMGKAMIANYATNAENVVMRMAEAYEQSVRQHADYRKDVILRSLKGQDAKRDVEIALAAEQEHGRFYREAAQEKAKALAAMAKIKLELMDAMRIQDQLAEYLGASGVSAEGATEIARMVAEELARRTGGK